MPIFAAFMVAAPELLVAETATATAAEIAAEAAAAEAAQAAAVEAAAAAAAEQAAQAGIMEVGGATANAVAPAPLTTAEAVQAAAQQSGLPEVANAGIQSVPQFSQAELEALTRGQEMARLSSAAPPLETTAGFNLNGTMLENTFLNNPSSVTDAMLRDPSVMGTPPAPVAPPVAPPAPPVAPPSPYGITGAGPNIPNPNYGLPSPVNAGGGESLRLGTSTEGFRIPNTPITSVSQTPMAEPPSSLMKGLNSAMDWVDKNPFKSSVIGYLGASKLGLLNPSGGGAGSVEEYDGPLKKYRISPDFQGSTANPANFQYTPRYAMGGGIMGNDPQSIPVGYDEGGNVPEYATGGSLSDSITRYQQMLDGKPREALPISRDVGIYYDQDPDTRYQDALTAAQIRQAKVNKRANMDLPGMKRPTPMGQLNLRPPGVAAGTSSSSLDPETAASGGIMHSSLGGYAAGGNPRLLRGPGDGMSDNIPATISGRQPARLADGEFVIPADVVSHLGNGSTEAGAKQLHAMMDKVREARTGNPKQGKNIKPQKYMPKTRA
jgi:hypothetical protein